MNTESVSSVMRKAWELCARIALMGVIIRTTLCLILTLSVIFGHWAVDVIACIAFSLMVINNRIL